MNQCQWFNLVTVCKDNFVLPLFTFRLSGPCINCALLNALYCFKLTGNQTSLITVVLASEMGLYYFELNIKTKRLIALMLCSADYTDNQSLYRLAAEVDNRGLAGARGDESFHGR